MLIGRVIGSRASAKYSIHVLLAIAAFLALSGFLAFWLGTNPIVNLLGLFSSGLGVANFYPLTVSEAIGAAGEKTTTATARLSLGTGLAMLVAPFVLGAVADKSNIFVAYGVVALLLTLCSIMVLVANLYSRRQAQ
jgi:predicted MFS family arabinose efflux permease